MEGVIPLCLSLTLFKLTLGSPIHKLVINRIKEKNDCVHVTFLLAWNFFFLHFQDDISSEEPSTMEKHKAMYGPVLLSLCQVCIVDYNLCKTAVTQKSLAASSACVTFFPSFGSVGRGVTGRVILTHLGKTNQLNSPVRLKDDGNWKTVKRRILCIWFNCKFLEIPLQKMCCRQWYVALILSL